MNRESTDIAIESKPPRIAPITFILHFSQIFLKFHTPKVWANEAPVYIIMYTVFYCFLT